MTAGAIDIGVLTGSGVGELFGPSEARSVETRFGDVEVSVSRLGSWSVGRISRHGTDHYHLPHTIPHRANLSALEHLGARAVLGTSVVGVLDPQAPLGRPILFDDLFFPDNLLPDGSPCTIFTEPGDPVRGHLIQEEPFSPRLRRKAAGASRALGIQIITGGTYGHVNGPRFNTAAEIRYLRSAGVLAVSQTCGPETVLAGELTLPYLLFGFPVNYAAGVTEPGATSELNRLLALSARTVPRLLSYTLETIEEEDMACGHGYVYRVEGGAVQDAGPRRGRPANAEPG